MDDISFEEMLHASCLKRDIWFINQIQFGLIIFECNSAL